MVSRDDAGKISAAGPRSSMTVATTAAIAAAETARPGIKTAAVVGAPKTARIRRRHVVVMIVMPVMSVIHVRMRMPGRFRRARLRHFVRLAPWEP